MMADPKLPLFGVAYPIQAEQISAWCWGSGCGKGLAGAINLGDGLPLVVPCNEPDCPYLDKQMDEPVGESEGRPLYLRKLREV
jgi:hypothetical protein